MCMFLWYVDFHNVSVCLARLETVDCCYCSVPMVGLVSVKSPLTMMKVHCSSDRLVIADVSST